MRWICSLSALAGERVGVRVVVLSAQALLGAALVLGPSSAMAAQHAGAEGGDRADAAPGARTTWQPAFAPVQAPLPPAIEGADPILGGLCRLGSGGDDDEQAAQHEAQQAQELPRLCLMVDAEAALGP